MRVRKFFWLALLLCTPSHAATLWNPVEVTYDFTIGGENSQGDYPVTLDTGSYVFHRLDTPNSVSRFNFIDAGGRVGYLDALVETNAAGSWTGQATFTSPEGRWFELLRHSLGYSAGNFTLDGQPYQVGQLVRATPGEHVLGFDLQGAGRGGALLRVVPTPEPSTVVIVVTLLGVATWWKVRAL